MKSFVLPTSWVPSPPLIWPRPSDRNSSFSFHPPIQGSSIHSSNSRGTSGRWNQENKLQSSGNLVHDTRRDSFNSFTSGIHCKSRMPSVTRICITLLHTTESPFSKRSRPILSNCPYRVTSPFQSPCLRTGAAVLPSNHRLQQSPARLNLNALI